MQTRATVDSFTLLGGPLHRMGLRLGLVRGHSDSFRLGLAIAALLWGVLVLLTLAEGLASQVFTLDRVGAHVRILVAIPLFFFCESVLDPRVGIFVRHLEESEIVPGHSLPQLQAIVASSNRLLDSWLPEAAILLFAVALLAGGSWLPFTGVTTVAGAPHGPLASTLTGHWYWAVCLTVVRFLMLRWLWRIALWCRFLWRLSRLHLHLVPTHPDGKAGLGYMQVVHGQFVPLILALSAIQSASLAEEVIRGQMQIDSVQPSVLVMLVLQALLFLGPLLILAPALREARLGGMDHYMEMASHYVQSFERKWLHVPGTPVKPMLGTADLQSLADLQNSLSMVEELNWIPVSVRLAIWVVGASIAPVLPLLLLKYPIAELSQKLLSMLVSL